MYFLLFNNSKVVVKVKKKLLSFTSNYHVTVTRRPGSLWGSSCLVVLALLKSLLAGFVAVNLMTFDKQWNTRQMSVERASNRSRMVVVTTALTHFFPYRNDVCAIVRAMYMQNIFHDMISVDCFTIFVLRYFSRCDCVLD